MGKYDDIINLPRPKSIRPSMNVADRAKIFMPFAALKGYDDAIGEKQTLTTERILISDERKEELNYKLHNLEEAITAGKKPEVTLSYFVVNDKVSKEENRELGNYVELTGPLKKVDTIFEVVRIFDQEIKLNDIFDIRLHEGNSTTL